MYIYDFADMDNLVLINTKSSYILNLMKCIVEYVSHYFMFLRNFEYLYLFGQPPTNISEVATSQAYSNMRSDPNALT